MQRCDNHSSNNTNKLSPQELVHLAHACNFCSNNTNKLSPQERCKLFVSLKERSNNTNKLSPQEQQKNLSMDMYVQIIQINLVLKNTQYEKMKN